MRASTLPTAALLLALAPALSSAQDGGDDASGGSAPTCVDGLYIILARGTNEPEDDSLVADLADRVADRIPGSEVVNVDYPATFTEPNYDDSESAGADAVKELVTEYHAACPDSRMALFGYSQGAHVTTDAVCGGYSLFTDIEPIPTDTIESSVVAIVLFGDPSFVANTTYSRGTDVNDGIFPRTNITICEDYEERLVSYCDAGDIYCDGDGEGEDDVHGSYVETYGDEVFDFVVERWEAETEDGPETDAPTTTTVGPASTSVVSTLSTNTESPPEPTNAEEPEGAAAGLVAGGALLALPLAAMAALSCSLL